MKVRITKFRKRFIFDKNNIIGCKFHSGDPNYSALIKKEKEEHYIDSQRFIPGAFEVFLSNLNSGMNTGYTNVILPSGRVLIKNSDGDWVFSS